MAKRWFVYGLMHHETKWLCYVGLTENPKARYLQHKNHCSGCLCLASQAEKV